MAQFTRIVVAAEREVVPGLQPAVIGAAEFVERSKFDHGIFLCGFSWSGSPAIAQAAPNCSKQAPKPPSTFSTVPVTNDAPGLAKNTTPPAISSAGPERCSACCVRWPSANAPPSAGF